MTQQQEQVRISQEAVVTAETQINKINSQKDKEFNAIVQEYVQAEELLGKYKKQEVAIENEIRLAEEAVRQSGFRGSVNAYFGGTPVSGKGYTDLANLISQSRSSIYTGEAMTKMRQNADILIDVDGNDVTFTTKFSENPSQGYSYQEMANIKNLISTGHLTEQQLKERYHFSDMAIFQSAFEDIEKQAAEAYITANIAEAEGGYVAEHSKYRLRRPSEVNSAIIEWRQSFRDELVKSGVPGDIIEKLIDEFDKKPGEFIKGGSELKDLYSRVGKRVVDSAKPSDGGKK